MAAEPIKRVEPVLPRTFVLDADGYPTMPRVDGFLEEYKSLCVRYQLAFSRERYYDGENDVISLEELNLADTSGFNEPILSTGISEYVASRKEAEECRDQQNARLSAAQLARM